MACKKRKRQKVSARTDRGDREHATLSFTRPAAEEVPFCDLMRPVGRAIHQHDSVPLFPIVLLWYVRREVCVLALMMGWQPFD